MAIAAFFFISSATKLPILISREKGLSETSGTAAAISVLIWLIPFSPNTWVLKMNSLACLERIVRSVRQYDCRCAVAYLGAVLIKRDRNVPISIGSSVWNWISVPPCKSISMLLPALMAKIIPLATERTRDTTKHILTNLKKSIWTDFMSFNIFSFLTRFNDSENWNKLREMNNAENMLETMPIDRIKAKPFIAPEPKR